MTKLGPGETAHAVPSFLPDQRHFLYHSRGTPGEIRVSSLDSSETKRITVSDSAAKYAGGHLLFVRQGTLLAQPFDTSRFVLLLVETNADHIYPLSWSPNGKILVYGIPDPKTAEDIWMLSLDGDRKPVPLLNSPFQEVWADISPDGRWLAYSSNETGRSEIYARPFPAGEGKWLVSTNGGGGARWRSDGKELIFDNAGSKMMTVSVNGSGAKFEAGTPRELFPSPYTRAMDNLAFNRGHRGHYLG